MLNINGNNASVNENKKAEETINMTNNIPMTNEAAALVNEINNNWAPFNSELKKIQGGYTLIVTILEDKKIGAKGGIASSMLLTHSSVDFVVRDNDANGNPLAEGNEFAATLSTLKKGLPLFLVQEHVSAYSQLVVLKERILQAASNTRIPQQCNLRLAVKEKIAAYTSIVKGAVQDGKNAEEFKALWLEKYKAGDNNEYFSKGERTVPAEIDAAVTALFTAMKQWHAKHIDSAIVVENLDKLFKTKLYFISQMWLNKELDPIWKQLAEMFAATKKNSVQTTVGVVFGTLDSDSTAAAKVAQMINASERQYCRLAYLATDKGDKGQFIGFVKDSKLLPLNRIYQVVMTGRQDKDGNFVLSNLKVNKAMSVCVEDTWGTADTSSVLNAVAKAGEGVKVNFTIKRGDVDTYNQIVLIAATSRSARANCKTSGKAIFVG